MNFVSIFYIGAHWLHLLAAIAAFGALVTIRLAVHPALHSGDPEVHAKAGPAIRKRVAKIISMGLLVLLVTGMFNLVRVFMNSELPPGYLGLFALKMLLVFAIFFIVAAMLVPSEAFAKFQQNRPMWMLVNIVLGAVVVLLSAWMGILRGG